MSLIGNEPTGNIDDIDADALLEQIESSSNQDIPMAAPQSDETVQETQPTQESIQQQIQELAFKHQDKEIRVPFTDPRVSQWASQGYDYAQKIAQFNQERQSILQQKEQYEKEYSPYKTIDQFAKENPEWWEHIQQSYEARKQGMPHGEEATRVPKEILDKLSKHEQFISQIEQEKERARIEKEDSALNQEISSIREQYKDLDWNTPDESGLSLEKRVIKHAVDNKIANFRAAFRDYNHDNLLKLTESRAKETLTKENQKRTKLGIIGQSPTSQKSVKTAEGIKNKTYDDLMREALFEAGIA